jgi:diguanylate cyclase (GGDEF)-like protein
MDLDLFESEQQIFDAAIHRIVEVRDGAVFDFEEYAKLAKEYGWLLKQLRGATRIADRTMTGLYESNLNLADKVHYDPLTGIYNRRYMEDALSRLMCSIARNADGQLSILMLDVDYFKNYNDTYGHRAGDSCLKAIADVLLVSITRVGDFAARYGGEEFVVVLPNTHKNGAIKIANRILENVRALGILHEKSDVAPCVTISIGVTTGNAYYTQSCYDYIKCADAALYMSKQGGRNKVTYLDFKEEKNEI